VPARHEAQTMALVEPDLPPVFTRATAHSAGLSMRQVDRRVTAHSWDRLRRGQFAVAGLDPEIRWRAEVVAVVSSHHRPLVLSHARSAGVEAAQTVRRMGSHDLRLRPAAVPSKRDAAHTRWPRARDADLDHRAASRHLSCPHRGGLCPLTAAARRSLAIADGRSAAVVSGGRACRRGRRSLDRGGRPRPCPGPSPRQGSSICDRARWQIHRASGPAVGGADSASETSSPRDRRQASRSQSGKRA
jgi:hypothetical protein